MAKKQKDQEPKVLTLYTIELSDKHMEKLHKILDDKGWIEHEVPYARFAFKDENVNVVGYNSGKLVVQGKNTESFVHYTLESEVTQEPRLGYEEFNHAEWFEPHAGLDECGKGDLFGPLIACCVIADGDMVRQWREAGIRDSKRISDNMILKYDKIIRKTRKVVVETVFCSMPKYNELMSRPRANLNRLLAWLHATALEKALKKRSVPWGLLDQFSKQDLVQQYFKNASFELRARTKAESDPVVAAASICARAEFIRQMQKLSSKVDEILLKGAGATVKKQAQSLVKKFGPEVLGHYAKLHFRTAYEVLGLPVPEKVEWKKR